MELVSFSSICGTPLTGAQPMPDSISMPAIALSLISLIPPVVQMRRIVLGNFWSGGICEPFFLTLCPCLTRVSSGKYFRIVERMSTHRSQHPTEPWRPSELHERGEGCYIMYMTCLISSNISDFICYRFCVVVDCRCLWDTWNKKNMIFVNDNHWKKFHEIEIPQWACINVETKLRDCHTLRGIQNMVLDGNTISARNKW